MENQITLGFDDRLIPEKGLEYATDVLIDRGSRYGYAFAHANGKDDLKYFLDSTRSIKSFSTADHCSYAFRIRSPEGILIEGKGDDGETGAGLCILREMRRQNLEQAALVISRHFGGIYLQADRYRNIVDVCRSAIDKIKR